MSRAPIALTLIVALALAACNPTFNWRETRIADSGLLALMPCKPDQLTRPVMVGTTRLDMRLTACDAGGASFAISHARVESASTANEVLAQWRSATLKNMGAESIAETPLDVGRGIGPATALVSARGKRGSSSVVNLQGVWFAQGVHVFHAAVYAPVVSPEMAESFFSGLKFQ